MGLSQLRNALPDVSSMGNMQGGKKRRTRGRKHSKSRRGAKRGGFAQIISDAIVPFGLVALTRRKQNRSKSSRKSRKNRRSRRSRR